MAALGFVHSSDGQLRTGTASKAGGRSCANTGCRDAAWESMTARAHHSCSDRVASPQAPTMHQIAGWLSRFCVGRTERMRLAEETLNERRAT